MFDMVSSANSSRQRKPPAERRAEIVAAAAGIALTEGLERITLRAVAARLGVRAGLITHYFPAVEKLTAEAFASSVAEERGRLFPSAGTPTQRLAHLVTLLQGPAALELARLWLNARHLARFNVSLAEGLEDQEALDREQLAALIAEGVAAGEFQTDDAEASAVRILTAVDGFGAYANNSATFEDSSFTRFISDVAEWTLGLAPGTLAS